MDPEQLGQRLREARKNSGLTQDEVASKLELPRTAVVKIESGERALSTLELANLAELYARPVAEFFEASPSGTAEVRLFRLLDPALAETPRVRREVKGALSTFEEGVALEKLLGCSGRSAPPHYDLPAPQSAYEAILQGNEVAEEERERLRLGASPIFYIDELVASEGVWCVGLPLPDEMSGFFVSGPEVGLAIVVNCSHPRERQRFSYAHEYAHAILDRRSGASVSKRGNSSDLVEKRANAFAAAFLMPKIGVSHQVNVLRKGKPRRFEEEMYSVADDAGIETKGRPDSPQDLTYQDVAHIAQHFGVSYEAAVYRLLNLGEMKKSHSKFLLEECVGLRLRYQKLLERLRPRGKDPAPNRELVKQVCLLAVEAYRREKISRGKLNEIAKNFGQDGRDLIEHAEALRKS